MPIRPRDLESVLQTKFSFAPAPSHDPDHRWYELKLSGLPTILTKVSHTKKEIGRALEAKIVRQLRVRKPFFQEMVGCTKGPQEYEAQLREDPYPPFDVRF